MVHSTPTQVRQVASASYPGRATEILSLCSSDPFYSVHRSETGDSLPAHATPGPIHSWSISTVFFLHPNLLHTHNCSILSVDFCNDLLLSVHVNYYIEIKLSFMVGLNTLIRLDLISYPNTVLILFSNSTTQHREHECYILYLLN